MKQQKKKKKCFDHLIFKEMNLLIKLKNYDN